MSYPYAYITGCFILSLFWLFIYIKRKDLRKEMLWASFIGLPFGFFDYFLVPQYWKPDSLFGLIEKYGFGIESFIFFFFMAGIASVIYEFLFKKKLVKINRSATKNYYPVLTTAISIIIFSIFYPTKAIYGLVVISGLGSIFIIYHRRDLWKQIFVTSVVFSCFYFLVFVLINLIFEGLVEYSYNLENISGLFILGVPIEELVVASFAGAFWSSLYEYTKSYIEK
ncbi:MAG: lycopene cyclase domain-containing protein [Candidatus Paceibacterota bacterium]